MVIFNPTKAAEHCISPVSTFWGLGSKMSARRQLLNHRNGQSTRFALFDGHVCWSTIEHVWGGREKSVRVGEGGVPGSEYHFSLRQKVRTGHVRKEIRSRVSFFLILKNIYVHPTMIGAPINLRFTLPTQSTSL